MAGAREVDGMAEQLSLFGEPQPAPGLRSDALHRGRDELPPRVGAHRGSRGSGGSGGSRRSGGASAAPGGPDGADLPPTSAGDREGAGADRRVPVPTGTSPGMPPVAAAPAPPPAAASPPRSSAPTPASLVSATAFTGSSAGRSAAGAGPAEVIFRHPRASREIRLGEAVVGYELTRARRRSIGMVVSTEGLSVRAPRWVGVAEIENALRAKAAWIRGKLVDQHERARRHEAARIQWADGVGLPFLGETVILVLDERVTGAILQTDPQALSGVPRLALHLGLPQTAEAAQIRDAVQAWLQRQARRVFEERCAHFAARLGVQVKRLQLSNAQTRWGSASADGSIRLNWRLIHFGMATIDYVVAHELAHLREMNHSPRFWDVVRSVIPDVDRVRQGLRNEVLPDLGA